MPRQSIENRLASLEKESAERLAGLEKEVQELKRQLTERISFEELRADVREIKTGVLELQVRYPAHEEYVTDRLNDFEAHVNERLDTVENHLTRLTDIAVDHKAGIEQLHASQQTLQAGQEQILAILNKQTKTND